MMITAVQDKGVNLIHGRPELVSRGLGSSRYILIYI